MGPKVTDSDGRPLAEASGRGAGYRYFGAAKQLPGVRELFEKEGPRQVGTCLVGLCMRGTWVQSCGC